MFCVLEGEAAAVDELRLEGRDPRLGHRNVGCCGSRGTAVMGSTGRASRGSYFSSGVCAGICAGQDIGRTGTSYSYGVSDSPGPWFGVFMSSDHDRLAEQWRRFRTRPFPNLEQNCEPTEDVLALWTDVADYDAAVAGAVERLVGRHPVGRAYDDRVLIFDDSLLDRARMLMRQMPQRQDLGTIVDYLDELRGLLTRASPHSS